MILYCTVSYQLEVLSIADGIDDNSIVNIALLVLSENGQQSKTETDVCVIIESLFE